MGKKSTFNTAKISFGLYGGFFKDVVQETGLDKALAMHANQGKAFGAGCVSMLKGELGRKKMNLAAWQSVYAKICNEFGITPECEKRRSTLKVKVRDCPIYAGCKAAGLDHKTIEMMCSQMSATEYEEIKKEYPQFSGCLKFRTTPDEPCIEEFVLLK